MIIVIRKDCTNFYSMGWCTDVAMRVTKIISCCLFLTWLFEAYLFLSFLLFLIFFLCLCALAYSFNFSQYYPLFLRFSLGCSSGRGWRTFNWALLVFASTSVLSDIYSLFSKRFKDWLWSNPFKQYMLIFSFFDQLDLWITN